MTTLMISLSEERKAFVGAEMVQEGFATASESFRHLIHAAQQRQDKQALEAKLREALESGPATPMTRAARRDLDDRP